MTNYHTIEIDSRDIATYWVDTCDGLDKPERKKTAILAMLAMALINEARGIDSGMTMLDTDLATECLERISCGEELTIKERIGNDY